MRMLRRTGFLATAALTLVAGVAYARGFSGLRSSARDLSLGEAGGASRPGAEQALLNPGALSAEGRLLWLEVGDASGVRQQRVGLAQGLGLWSASFDLGLDSVEGLELRDGAGQLTGTQDLWAPWGLVAVSRPAWVGSWGLALGGRDRAWLGAGFAPEVGLGWALHTPWSWGLSLWLRDQALQGQVSTAWRPSSVPVGLEAGYIFEGAESRLGVGAQWFWGSSLALRMGWSRWTGLENQRVSVGLGWQGGAQSLAYAWLPGAGVGSSQKLGVQVALQASTPLPAATPTISPSATPTPSPSITATPEVTLAAPTLTPTLSPTPRRKEIELDFVLPE